MPKIELPSIKAVEQIHISPLKTPKEPHDDQIVALRDALVAIHKCLSQTVDRLDQLESEPRS